MLNRFLELDKDFKKGNLTLTDGSNIFTCTFSRSVAQREAEKSSVSLQPSGKVPGTERKPVQVRIGQMWMNIQIYFFQEANLQDLLNGWHRQPWWVSNSKLCNVVKFQCPSSIFFILCQIPFVSCFGCCVTGLGENSKFKRSLRVLPSLLLLERASTKRDEAALRLQDLRLRPGQLHRDQRH